MISWTLERTKHSQTTEGENATQRNLTPPRQLQRSDHKGGDNDNDQIASDIERSIGKPECCKVDACAVTTVCFLVKRIFHGSALKYGAEHRRYSESYHNTHDGPTKGVEPTVDAKDPEIEEQDGHFSETNIDLIEDLGKEVKLQGFVHHRLWDLPGVLTEPPFAAYYHLNADDFCED